MDLLVTLDVGTTSIKTCLFDYKFNKLGFSSEEYSIYTPERGIVELNPEIYWKAAKKGIKNVIDLSGIDPLDIKVISIVSQGETLIPVDNKCRAVRNAIVWLDTRAEKEARSISNTFSNELIYSTTGLPELTGACPVCKILWIKNNEQEVYNKTYKFLLLEDYLILKLTGKFITDKSIMSSTGYFDINKGELWEDVIVNIGIDREKFPVIMDCGVEAGRVLMDVVDELGINPAAIVSTGAMDQAASAIGAGNILEGIVSETTGTALVIAATVDHPDYSNKFKLPIYKHAVSNKYMVLPYCPTAGIILKWFKDEFFKYEEIECARQGKVSIYSYLDKLAEQSSRLSNGLLIIPHFAGMLTPEINPAAKGVFFGVGLDTRKQHFIRAILESVAFMLRENIELLESSGTCVNEICSLGGASKSEIWCRIKADITNKAICTVKQDESTSLGAAILGSIAAGIYGSIEDACSTIKIKKRYVPETEACREYEKGYITYKKLSDCLKPLFV